MYRYIIYSICLSLITINLIFILVISLLKDKKKELSKREVENIAVLIPARNESKVIEKLLISLVNQSYKLNRSDIFVIVESKEDKTVDICEKYQVSYLIRTDFSVKTKGKALDEAIKKIINIKDYQMYFIFDADNRLENNFIKEMVNTYKKGYLYSIGKRESTNLNYNRFSYCSGLLFSLLNDLGNMKRQNKNKNIIASGTGYYIAGDIINKLQGFPFNSLTEDYEFSLYATLNHIPGYYNTNAVFYDEQPTDKKTTYTQRSRWCKGFQETRKKYMKEIKLNKRNISIYHEYIGVNHYISLIFVYALTLISSIALTIYNSINKLDFQIDLIVTICLLLIPLFVLSMIGLILTNKINCKKILKSYIYAIFYFPIYIFQFVPIYFIAKHKAISWDVINHSGK